MNRHALILGIAIFVAIVGLSVLGGENQAMAGHGCQGCGGCSACDGCYGCSGYACGGCDGCGGCGGYARCCGVRRVHVRRQSRCGCSGYVSSCGGVVMHYGGGHIQKGGVHVQKGGVHVQKGGVHVQKGGPAVQKGGSMQKGVSYQKAASANFERAPLVFRRVSFRR